MVGTGSSGPLVGGCDVGVDVGATGSGGAIVVVVGFEIGTSVAGVFTALSFLNKALVNKLPLAAPFNPCPCIFRGDEKAEPPPALGNEGISNGLNTLPFPPNAKLPLPLGVNVPVPPLPGRLPPGVPVGVIGIGSPLAPIQPKIGCGAAILPLGVPGNDTGMRLLKAGGISGDCIVASISTIVDSLRNA